jgi:Ca2+-binding EF-hand superfamily protein
VIALFRRIDSPGTGVIELAEIESFMKRFAAKFRRDFSESDIATQLQDFGDVAITEDIFADYVCQTYGDVDNEAFFAFLDFCDSASYFLRSRRLRTLFWKMDTDGSGYIETDETRQHLKKMGLKLDMPLTDNDLTEAVKDFMFVDSNGDGKISEDEFITNFLEIFDTVDDNAFIAALDVFDVATDTDRNIIFSNMFSRHDLDKDGFLDADEVKLYFLKFGEKIGRPLSPEDLDDAVMQFSAVDTNGDGKISKQEFVDYFMSETAAVSDEQFYELIEFFDA